MADLSIRVDSVTETPAPIVLETSTAWWECVRQAFQESTSKALEPFVVRLEGYRIGERLLFRGRLAGTVELDCGRCAEAYPQEFSEPLELLLEPAQNPERIPEGGIELDAEDLELGRYAGDELDFQPVILEILSLVWPMQPLCTEECRGLCAVCGRNRNTQTCSCETQAADRPLAGLGKLLEDSRKKSRSSEG
jgi:uncharacterized protein